MITLAGHCRTKPAATEATSAPAAPAKTATPPPAQRLQLRWSISPQAARRITGAAAATTLIIETPWPEKDGPLAARLVQDGESGAGRAEAIAIQCDSHARWIIDDRAGLAHLEVPEFLHATLRLEADHIHILYIRTSLLQRLGIGGGRYDFEGAQVLR
jgi:hypothetical protein